MVRNQKKQHGIALVEMAMFVLFLSGVIWSVAAVARLYALQDRLHLAVSTVGTLAADIPPQNEVNLRFESILCGKSNTALRFDECPESITSQFLYEAAIQTLGTKYEGRFAMRFEFVSDPRIAQSQEFAKSDIIGQGQCDLTPFVPGGVRINSYLTNPSSTNTTTLKNRAHHQFIYMAMCVEPLGIAGRLASLVNKPLFADSMSLRRYWYDGDYIE
ncbi:hypothetical protein AB6E04_07150 [Vibrio amylolyticus]|uniref:hypothetical protein n=1 Tax=Vibrio amylolyticus TaxID=2847292 RepID=UPI00354DB475